VVTLVEHDGVPAAVLLAVSSGGARQIDLAD
jgi:hypothetical protein